MANIKNLVKNETVENLHMPNGTILEIPTFEYSWEWTDGFGKTHAYKTYAHGDGLAVWTGTGWRQISGTCQFSLPANKEAARKKLNRMFNRKQ